MLRISPRNNAAKIQNYSIVPLFSDKKTALIEDGLEIVIALSFHSKTIEKSIFSKGHRPYTSSLLTTINAITNTTRLNMLQITIHLL